MPNPRLYGFRYLGPMVGNKPTKPIRYRVASAYAFPINIGDPVEMIAGGTCILSVAGGAGVGLATIGIVTGIAPYWDGVKMAVGNYLPANTTPGAVNFERESYVYVIPAANNLFECCCGDLTNVTRAAYLALIGQNIPHMYTVVGTLNWPELNTAHPPVATTDQWRIMDLPRTVNVDWAALYVPLIVSGNEIATPPASPLAGI